MTVLRWNALRDFDDLFARAESRVARATRPVSRQSARPASRGFVPLADISETAAGYLLELELPGFAAADVAVAVDDGVLSVAGERRASYLQAAPVDDASQSAAATEVAATEVAATEVAATKAAATEAEAAETAAAEAPERPQVHRSERQYGKFERRFALPEDADVEAIEASAKDGVLSLHIGRRENDSRRAIKVKVA